MPRRRRYRHSGGFRPEITRRQRAALFVVFLGAFLVFFYLVPMRSLRDIAGQMALSAARDLITYKINHIVGEKMSSGEFDYDELVTVETGENGAVTALKTNMSRINALSSEIMRDVVGGDGGDGGDGVDISIPIGNLLGSTFFSGRGPKIPVKIIMLTASYSDFRNELVSAGINQTKHQIILEVKVMVHVLIPWDTLSTEVSNDVLVAETVIIGEVPGSYINVE